jgi:hypothetical protein
MENADNTPLAEISRMAVCFTPVWAERPLTWFASKNSKFCYVVSQLDQRYATEIEDITTSLPGRGPYPTLRTRTREAAVSLKRAMNPPAPYA